MTKRGYNQDVPCMTSSLFHLRSSFLSILDKSDQQCFLWPNPIDAQSRFCKLLMGQSATMLFKQSLCQQKRESKAGMPLFQHSGFAAHSPSKVPCPIRQFFTKINIVLVCWSFMSFPFGRFPPANRDARQWAPSGGLCIRSEVGDQRTLWLPAQPV